MKIGAISELYELISRGSENILTRKKSIELRKITLSAMVNGKSLTKIAFDTRRINQETDYIPRRGLQNYHRSEKFVSDAMTYKIQAFTKLMSVLDKVKSEYHKEVAWQDSYARILTSAVQKGLRQEQSDGDFSDTQPSMGNLNYLEELMYVRYRLTPDNILSMSEDELYKSLLSKDEVLLHNGFSKQYVIEPREVEKYSYDNMMDKILYTVSQALIAQKPVPQDDLMSKLFNVKATKDSPEVERAVTITIKDSIKDTTKETIKESSLETIEEIIKDQ